MSAYKWYNNGKRNIKVYQDTIIPEDFHEGYLMKPNPWNKGLTKETDSRLICSEETRQKHHEQNVGENNPMYGKTHTNESKKKISNKKKGKASWNKGLTKETNDSVKSTSEKLKGHEYFGDIEEKLKKEYITKKKNNSFNSSKQEDKYYEYLLTIYDEKDIQRQYKDDRYPFACDFHIISEDLFIECNYHWTHGGKLFDKNDESCMKQLNEWIEKSKNSQFYKNAIHTWTELDVEKFDTANRNKLNYKIIYE